MSMSSPTPPTPSQRPNWYGAPGPLAPAADSEDYAAARQRYMDTRGDTEADTASATAQRPAGAASPSSSAPRSERFDRMVNDPDAYFAEARQRASKSFRVPLEQHAPEAAAARKRGRRTAGEWIYDKADDHLGTVEHLRRRRLNSVTLAVLGVVSGSLLALVLGGGWAWVIPLGVLILGGNLIYTVHRAAKTREQDLATFRAGRRPGAGSL